MITAKKIRSKRKANDILQSELANYIGATTSYICNVESGGSVSYKQLTLIMNAVDEIILDKKQSR